MRGTPALLLYRGVLGFRDRAALAVFSATGAAADRGDHHDRGRRRGTCAPSTAAALVGAGILSTAILPVVGLRLRAGAPKDDDPLQVPDEGAAVASA